MERTNKRQIAISVLISVLVFALMMFVGLTASVSKVGNVANAEETQVLSDYPIIKATSDMVPNNSKRPTADLFPCFMSVSYDKIKSWTDFSTDETIYLIYEFDEDGLYYSLFSNGAWRENGIHFTNDNMSLRSMLGGGSYYYTASGGPAQVGGKYFIGSSIIFESESTIRYSGSSGTITAIIDAGTYTVVEPEYDSANWLFVFKEQFKYQSASRDLSVIALPGGSSPAGFKCTSASPYYEFAAFYSEDESSGSGDEQEQGQGGDPQPTGHTHNDVTFTATDSLPTSAGNYYLTADVTIDRTWNVPSGTTNLCLNGHVIAAASNVCISVITVQSGCTLNLYDCDTTTHYYYVNPDTYKQNRSLERNNMYDIGEIAVDGNDSAYVASTKKGTFEGGYITGGTGQGLTTNGNIISGGGFQIYGGGTLNMYGGCIFGNYTSAITSDGNDGGGVYVYENGVFNMNGGYIIGNQGGNCGGGVENCGAFTMNGGYIGHNTAGDGGWAGGGGVENGGTMTMNGGVIEGNEAGGHGNLRGKWGGGIENNGSLTINGGSIINNFCDNFGGGILNSGNLTINGGSIINNYNDETKKADNVYLNTDKKITLGSALTEKNSVGVTIQSGTGVFTTGWSDCMDVDANPADYFFSDAENYGVYLQDGEAAILPGHAHNKVTFTATDSLPTSAGNYYLTADVTIGSTWNVPSGTTNLCLNGHGIKSNQLYRMILVDSGATLNIYDCDETTTHKFTVNNDGLATVNDALTDDYLTFTGGYITGGYSTTYDEGAPTMHVNGGVVNMYGGNVIGNRGTQHIGAIKVENNGHFTLAGGSIQYNVSYYTAPAIFVSNGTLTITGGLISNNTSTDNLDSGVKTCDNSTLEISGNPTISGNNGGSDLQLETNMIITGPLTNTTPIVVGIWLNKQDKGVFTSGWSTYMKGVDPADYFYSKNENYGVYLMDGEAAILAEAPHPVASVGEVKYGSLLEAYEAASENDVIVLLADIDISDEWNYILVKKSITLDINGHILNVGTYQAAIKVGDSETRTPVVLTVKNSAPKDGGVLGICGVSDDGSYILFYDARLGFTKEQVEATSDINRIAEGYEVVTIASTDPAYKQGFHSLIRPESGNEFKLLIKIAGKAVEPSDYSAYIDDGEKVVRVYGVTLYRIAIDGGEEQEPVSVQPSDIGNNFTLTIKLTVPSELIGKNFRVLRAADHAFVDFTTDEDGTHIRISGVDRLSDFAFVALESDLIPSGQDDGQGGEQGQPEEQEQGQGEVPTIEPEPEITKEDDPTIDNWEITPQGSTEPSDDVPSSEVPKPAVTVALEDTEPQSDVSVEVELKTEVSEEVAEIRDNTLNQVLQSDDEIAVVYGVKLIRTTIENGIEIREEIQPSDIKSGTVVVINMTIPESLRGKSFRMLHIHSEKDIKEISYTVSEDGTTATVRVDRLSEFAFIGKAMGGESNEPNKIPDGAIIGIVVGGSFGILFLGLLIFFLLKRKKKEEDLDDNEAVSAAPIPVVAAAGAFAVSEQPALQLVKGEMAVADSDEGADDGIVVYSKGNYFNIRYNKSFTAKIIQSSDETKGYYGELKNEVLSYTKTKSHVSWAYDSVNAGREHIVKFGVRGKTLCVYFPLNVEDLDEKYKVEKVDAAKYATVPCLYRIKNERRLRYAKELIEKVCLSIGLTKGEVKSEDYYLPYETNEPLIAKGLIKELTVKATATQIENAKKEGSIRVVDNVSASDVNDMISHEVALAAIIKTDRHATGKKGIINVDTLSLNFNDGDTVTVQGLKEKKLIAHDIKQVKLLARGNLDKVLHVELQDYSIEAVKMILATGGTVKRC